MNYDVKRREYKTGHCSSESEVPILSDSLLMHIKTQISEKL